MYCIIFLVSSKHVVEMKRQLLVERLIKRISNHGDLTHIMSKLASEVIEELFEVMNNL
jgi:hypothetical protein